MSADDRVADTEELVLSDLLNRVLDRGVVIAGTVTIAVANIDLVRVGLNIFIAAVETEVRKAAERERTRGSLFNADIPVLRPPREP